MYLLLSSTVIFQTVRSDAMPEPKLLLSRDINAAINFTYWRRSSGWEKLVEGVFITDFIENREQGLESFPGL